MIGAWGVSALLILMGLAGTPTVWLAWIVAELRHRIGRP